MKKIWLLAILASALQSVHAADLRLGAKELEAVFVPEYNRSFLFCWDIAASGNITFNDIYLARGGIAMGSIDDGFSMKMFAGGEVSPFERLPFSFSLDWKHGSIDSMEYVSDSLQALVSLKLKRWIISAGPAFRFESFSGSRPVFEPILAAQVCAFIIDSETFRLGVKLANFDSFTSGNFASYFINVNSLVRLGRNMEIINEIDIQQSGSIGLAANFYGLAYRGGVRFLW